MIRLLKKCYHALVAFLKKVRKLFKKSVATWKIAFVPIHRESGANDAIPPLSDLYPDRGSDPATDAPFLDIEPSCDLSIIIPAYNVAPFLDECIDSVLRQKTDRSFEILIMDDESTDGTYERLQQYEKQDARIRLFSQKNGGRAVACNNALRKATGRYIMFLDADDLLADGAVDALVKEAERTGSDIVEGSFVRFDESEKPTITQPKKQTSKTYSYKKNPNFVLTSYGYSWAKVYKRELWENVRFPNGYILQDIVTKFALRRIANSVTYINTNVAAYRYRRSSSSHGKRVSKKLDCIWLFPRVVRISDQAGAARDRVFYLLALNHLGILDYIMLRELDVDLQKSAFEEIKKQLRAIQPEKPYRMPLAFAKLNKAILCGDFEAWKTIADFINGKGLLRRYREFN